LGELEWQHAHPNEVRSVDPLVRLRDHGLNPEQRRALRGPVPRGARTVLLASQHHEWSARSQVVLRRLVNRRLWCVRNGEVLGESSFCPRCKLVAKPNVGERAADLDLMIAPPGPVGVEILPLYTVLGQVLPSGRVRLDGASRAYV